MLTGREKWDFHCTGKRRKKELKAASTHIVFHTIATLSFFLRLLPAQRESQFTVLRHEELTEGMGLNNEGVPKSEE